MKELVFEHESPYANDQDWGLYFNLRMRWESNV